MSLTYTGLAGSCNNFRFSSSDLKFERGMGFQTTTWTTPHDATELSVGSPGEVAQDADVSLIASGVAADQDGVAVKWTTGGCPAAAAAADAPSPVQAGRQRKMRSEASSAWRAASEGPSSAGKSTTSTAKPALPSRPAMSGA